jgi:hypothetical protein
MRATIAFDHHAEHAWSHFAIRLLLVLLILFLILVFAGDSLGGTCRRELGPELCDATLTPIYESLGS